MENKPEYILLLIFNAYSRVAAFLDATVTVTRAKLAGLTSPGVLEQKGYQAPVPTFILQFQWLDIVLYGSPSIFSSLSKLFIIHSRLLLSTVKLQVRSLQL